MALAQFDYGGTTAPSHQRGLPGLSRAREPPAVLPHDPQFFLGNIPQGVQPLQRRGGGIEAEDARVHVQTVADAGVRDLAGRELQAEGVKGRQEWFLLMVIVIAGCQSL